MRRLWAYILLAFTSLVLVGVSFVPLMRNTNANIDYQSGREILFHIESKDESVELSKDQLGELADMMSQRLENQKVTRYEVDVQGNDTIAVILSQDYEQQYANIVQYMEFDGSFALTNSAGTYALADEFLLDGGKASLETYNGYPCITLPVNVEGEKYKEVLEGAKGEGAKPETQTSGEGEDATTTETYYMYLWYGFEEKLITEETDYSSDSHIIMKFRVADADNEEDKQYFPDTDNKLFSVLNLDTNGDGTASYSEKSQAFDTANYYVNLLNASKLEVSGINGEKIDVVVKNFGSNYVDAWIEQTISLGTVASIAFTPTFIATLCAIVLVSVLLVYFYRLGAVGVITTTIVSLFAGLASMVLLTAEFTTISIFAFIALAISSLASGVVLLNKIKDEAYRGRSLKKANLEGFKKALLPIIDIHVVLILIGVFAYIMGGSAMRTFAAITVLGGVASVILCTLGLKLLLWLAFNATNLQGKYQYFGIDGEKVPDLISEEKPTYFGPYADKDLTKAKTKVGIGGGVILLATTVAMIVFGVVSGSIYAEKKNNGFDRVYFETTMAENSQINNTTINTILEKTFVYEDKDGDNTPSAEEMAAAKSLASYGIAKIDSSGKTYIVTNEVDEDISHYVHVAYLNGTVADNLKAYYLNDDGTALIPEGEVDYGVNSVIAWAIDKKGLLEDVATVSLKKVSSHNIGQPNVLHIAMSALVGVAVSGFYLLLRYRLSRGLVATVLAIATGSVALGLLSLIHLPVVGGYVAVIAPVAALASLIMSIMFMNKEREMVLEDKSKDKSLENRRAISIKAVSLSYSSVTIFSILSVFICINFFGFGSNFTALSFIALILTMLIALVVNPIVIAPLSNVLYGLFSRVNIKRPTLKKKAKARKVNKSAEPEEAVFIGIND